MSQSAVTNDILESRTLKLRKAFNLWCCHRFCSLVVPSGQSQQLLGVWLSLTLGVYYPAVQLRPLGCDSWDPWLGDVVTSAKVQHEELSFHLWLVTGRIFPSGFGLSAVKQLLIISCTVCQVGEKLSHLYSLPNPSVPVSFVFSSFSWFHLGFFLIHPEALVRRSFNVTQDCGRARKKGMGDMWCAGLPVLGRGWPGVLLSQSFWITRGERRRNPDLSHTSFFLRQT